MANMHKKTMADLVQRVLRKQASEETLSLGQLADNAQYDSELLTHMQQNFLGLELANGQFSGSQYQHLGKIRQDDGSTYHAIRRRFDWTGSEQGKVWHESPAKYEWH